MTVKCLTANQKQNIIVLFQGGNYNLDELARAYVRSRRTIVRVLEEADVDPGIKHRQRKPKPVPAPMPVPPEDSSPWYHLLRRVFSRMREQISL